MGNAGCDKSGAAGAVPCGAVGTVDDVLVELERLISEAEEFEADASALAPDPPLQAARPKASGPQTASNLIKEKDCFVFFIGFLEIALVGSYLMSMTIGK
jgi:hypothetical protein